MRHNYQGCAICDSTWGDVWEEREGERLFFCCALCARQFHNLLVEVHRTTGWGRLDAIDIEGDRRGRLVTIESEGRRRRFAVTFTPSGDLLTFSESPQAGGSEGGPASPRRVP